MRRALFGDLHLGVRNGDANFLKFQLTYLKKKIDEVKGLGITHIDQLGDSIDNRRRSESTVNDALLEICEYAYQQGITIDFLIGNHNTFYTDTNRVHNLNIIKNFHRGNVRIIEESFEEGNVLTLGWIHKNNLEAQMAAVENTSAKFCFMHAQFDGFDMYSGIKAKGGMSIVPFRKFQKVYTGHYHTVSEDGNVKYIGSPYALTWMDFVDGTNRGWFELDDETGAEIFHRNLPGETLFHTHVYNPDEAYDEFSFLQYKDCLVKFFVREVKSELHYKKFVELVNAQSYIDRRIIDERELLQVEQEAIDISEMNLTPLKVIEGYVRDEATLNGLNPDNCANLALTLYQEASGYASNE